MLNKNWPTLMFLNRQDHLQLVSEGRSRISEFRFQTVRCRWFGYTV